MTIHVCKHESFALASGATSFFMVYITASGFVLVFCMREPCVKAN